MTVQQGMQHCRSSATTGGVSLMAEFGDGTVYCVPASDDAKDLQDVSANLRVRVL